MGPPSLSEYMAFCNSRFELPIRALDLDANRPSTTSAPSATCSAFPVPNTFVTTLLDIPLLQSNCSSWLLPILAALFRHLVDAVVLFVVPKGSLSPSGCITSCDKF